LPNTPARTRFAPSPTGYLHLGSLRTALFNYLLAKKTGGQFLLRIEDTDQKRTVPDAEERLLKDLRWAGLQWDEGPEVGGPYGPYKQSERSELYREHAGYLLATGHAYRCFCSSQRLNDLAEHRHKLGLATDYDRTCANISQSESDARAEEGQKYVIRLKVPDIYPSYKDLIYGKFAPLKKKIGEDSWEDPILLKSDGLPTYHLANVVDDHHMKITHVIRGSEWMPSTPKHIAMYNAFGWEPPHFAHVGLLVDENGNKLSKRNFDTDIEAFKEMEVFPETLTNFAALLGWSHTERSDVMDLQKLTEKFSMKFTKGNTTVTFGKLHHLQKKHAHARAKAGGQGLQDMVQAVLRLLEDTEGPYKKTDWKPIISASPFPAPERFIEQIILGDAESYTNANEFIYKHSYLFRPVNPSDSTPELLEKVPQHCFKRFQSFADIEEKDWNADTLRRKMQYILGPKDDLQPGESKAVYHYLRKKLTGLEEGLRIYSVLELLGREECLWRLSITEEKKTVP
jgi:glutamyl-tRNA synthetase